MNWAVLFGKGTAQPEGIVTDDAEGNRTLCPRRPDRRALPLSYRTPFMRNLRRSLIQPSEAKVQEYVEMCERSARNLSDVVKQTRLLHTRLRKQGLSISS